MQCIHLGGTKHKITSRLRSGKQQELYRYSPHMLCTLTAVWAETLCRQEVKRFKYCHIRTTHWKYSKWSMWNTADAEQQGRPKTKGHLFFVAAPSFSVRSLWAESRVALNECVILVRLSVFDEQPPVILRQPPPPLTTTTPNRAIDN